MNIINSRKKYMDQKADKSEMIGIVAQTNTLNNPLTDLNSSFFFFESLLIPTVHASLHRAATKTKLDQSLDWLQLYMQLSTLET